MSKFDPEAHAKMIGNVLKVMGVFALTIALAGFIPEAIFSLPPHFFGDGGAVAVGALLLFSGFLLKK